LCAVCWVTDTISRSALKGAGLNTVSIHYRANAEKPDDGGNKSANHQANPPGHELIGVALVSGGCGYAFRTHEDTPQDWAERPER
jgi:hypothetical protein